MSSEVTYTDCLGKPLEARRYALLEGSRVRLVELARIDGDWCVLANGIVEGLVNDAEGDIMRYGDWAVMNNRASLLESLEDIAEVAAMHRRAQSDLIEQLKAVLHFEDGGDNDDFVLGFIRDGRGTIEELLQLKVGA